LAFGSRRDSFEAGSAFSGSSSPSFALLAGGTGFFVLSENPKPDFVVVVVVVVGGAAEDLAGGAGFCSSFEPSSSTRRSFEGRKGLSSASTDVESAVV
jgi:hypothetical protein